MIRAASQEGILVPTAALEEVPLFAGLRPDELAAVTGAMHYHEFQPGDFLCLEGEPADRMLVVLDGLANAMTLVPDVADARGRSFFAEGRLVGKHRHGDPIGVRELITGEPHSATVKAVVPTSALELGEAEFRLLLGRYPQLLTNLVRILGERLAEAHSRYARAGTRGEAVALVAGPGLEDALPAIAAAAAAASARPLAWLDARGGLSESLERLDGALRENATMLVAIGAGEGLGTLIEQVDRTVAVVAAADAERLAGALGLTLAEEVEAVLVEDGRVSCRGLRGTLRGGMALAGTIGRDGDGRLAGGDVAWLGRHLSRTKLGLALGAGGAKGYAHVGALAVLEQAGYVVDCVAGSSIGAIVGTYIALGMDAATIERTLRESFDEEANAQIFQLSLAGTSTGLDVMTRLLQQTTGEQDFDSVRIPLAVMTADLTEREPAPLREGSLWQALLAATALVGMFPPYERGGHRLVDGLALVPVPTGAVIEDGADITVSVNLMSREILPAWPGEEAPPPDPPKRPGSRMLETMLEVMDLAQLDNSVRHAGLADVVLTPRFGPGTWRDFELADRFMAAGRRAAEEQLPALQALALPQHRTPTQGGANGSADVLVR